MRDPQQRRKALGELWQSVDFTKTHFPEVTIDRGELGPVVGTHGGPGVIGVGILVAR